MSAFTVLLLVACGGGGGDAVVVTLPSYPGTTLYYVNDAATDDSGDGLTPATAKKTIPAAITAAIAPASILIADGIYNVDSTPGIDTHVILVNDVSLYGGYNSTFTAYGPENYNATIYDNNVDNTNGGLTPGCTIYADGAAVTSTTIVDSITIMGGFIITSNGFITIKPKAFFKATVSSA